MKSSAKIPASLFLVPAGLLFVSLLCLLVLLTGSLQKEAKTVALRTQEETGNAGEESGGFREEILADEKQIPVDSEEASSAKATPLYAIGSVSKVYCAAAVLKLVDRGQVDLDAPVLYYIPEFQMADERYREITVRMLLNHSSGLMGTTITDNFLLGSQGADYQTLFMENLKKQRLKADPGAYGVYCNDGFTLAEILVERVSGSSFMDFLETEFFVPLGITQTKASFELRPAAAHADTSSLDMDALDVAASDTAGLAAADFDHTAPVYYGNHALPFENIQSIGAGGLYASPEDVCRFAGIFTDRGKGLLTDRALQAMASKEYQRDRICTREEAGLFGYGLGWDSVEAPPFSTYGRQAFTKGGDVVYHHTALTVLPKENLSVCVTSSGGASIYCQLIAQDIVAGILSEDVKEATGGPKETDTLRETDALRKTGTLREKDTLRETENAEEEKSATRSEDVQKIPDTLLPYAGIYASGEVWKAEFTDRNTLLLTSLENDREAICEFRYEGNESFVSTQGDYIGPEGTLSHTTGGIVGSTRLSFRTEENGRSYMIGSIGMENALDGAGSQEPVGSATLLAPLAEKIEEAPLAGNTAKAWEARNGKKYYLISETANSNAWLANPLLRVELLAAVPGYTGTSEKVKACKIIDENQAKCLLQLPVAIGRDLVDYRFYQEDGVEYLELSNGMTLMEGKGMQPSHALSGTVRSKEKGNWYYVTPEDAGEECRIELPEGGNYYVYDVYDDCVDSSLFGEKEKNSDTILLPEGGKILLAAAVGERFVITREGTPVK